MTAAEMTDDDLCTEFMVLYRECRDAEPELPYSHPTRMRFRDVAAEVRKRGLIKSLRERGDAIEG